MNNEYGAQERAAHASRILLLEGPQRAADLTARLYGADSEAVWPLLDNISQPLSLVNDGGWWHVNFETPFDHVQNLLRETGLRLEESSYGLAFCRSYKRRDIVYLYEVLKHIYKIGKAP